MGQKANTGGSEQQADTESQHEPTFVERERLKTLRKQKSASWTESKCMNERGSLLTVCVFGGPAEGLRPL